MAELSPDREGFFITFTVEEGERYKFGKIGIDDDADATSNPRSLRDRLTTDEGDWYNAEEVEKSIGNLTDALGDLGYRLRRYPPRVDRDREQAAPSTSTYEIEEGPRVYVDRIDITGNVRTLDKVIRREMRLVEGDAFNTSKLRRSEQPHPGSRLLRARSTSRPTEGAQPDRPSSRWMCRSSRPAKSHSALGFSTIDGPLASVGIRERNLLGRGQDLRFSATVSGTDAGIRPQLHRAVLPGARSGGGRRRVPDHPRQPE